MPQARRPGQRPGLRVVARPGSTALYLRGTVRGQRIFESAGTDDPDRAEEARAAREVELFRGAVLGIKPRVTFAAAALSYLQKEQRPAAMQVAIQKLVRLWGPALACEQVDQARLDRAARTLCMIGSQPATHLRQVITPAKAVLSHAARRGWCPLPAFERVAAGEARTEWLTPAEAEAVIGHANPRVQPLLVFLFCSGARMSEAVALDWVDVDLAHARAVLRNTKNGRDRRVDLPPRAIAALANLAHRQGAVFRHRSGQAYRQTDDSTTVPFGGQIRYAWATAVKAAGLAHRDLTPHCARHTWASWDYCVHKDLLALRTRGDWSSVDLVERYAHLVPAGLRPKVLAFRGEGANLVQATG